VPVSAASSDDASRNAQAARSDGGAEGSVGGDALSSDAAVTHVQAVLTVTVGNVAGGFYVADDGTGIPAEERDEVFEAGYSTTNSGAGLGPNIVQEIVQAHGWEISVTDSDGGGARFEITGVTGST